MTALLERLNASRRFARSVYAPHKLALRQGVPSVLRAVGVTAPAPQAMNAPRKVVSNIAPRVIAAAVPLLIRADAVPPSAVGRPNTAANPVALEPQAAPNLEPQAASNLEPQGLANLEPQGASDPESPTSANLEPQDSSNLESPLNDAAFSAALLESGTDSSLEFAAPAQLALPEPMLESADAVTVKPLLQQPSAQTEPVAVQLSELQPSELQPSAPLELSAPANAPAMRVAETQGAAEQPVSPPIPRASAAQQGIVGERLKLAQENEPDAQSSPELAASAMPETLAAALTQPLEPQAARFEPVSLEPRFVTPDLEGLGDAPAVRELAANEPAANEPIANEPVTSQPAPLEVLPGPLVPEVIAPSVAAPVSLEVAAPPAADQPPARGRVIEEFQARPPRNMPPRNLNLKVAAPEVVPEAPADATPRRSPEEWARLLRQRFAQPGDEAFEDADAPTPAAAPEAAQPETVRLETAPSAMPATVLPASLEPSALVAAPPSETRALASGTPTVAAGESESLSVESIRERSQAALQAIPEDMSQRTPRDWGLALIRRYASLDEAAAIGIEAYRDPNDPNPIPTPAPISTRPVAPRAMLAALAPISAASNTTVSSSTDSSTTDSSSSDPSSSDPSSTDPRRLSASALLEPAPSPARRFVAPRMVVSSTAPGLTPITPARIAPVEAGLVGAQPAAQQRSPASLEPSSATDSVVDAPLETEDLVAPQTDAGLEPVPFEDSQTARAALHERPASGFSASITPQNTAQLEAPTTPTLEPVRLSGATRRFLEPLVGFDPNEVSVYTGDAASRTTRDLRAEAAAQNGAVLLPDASNLETPAQLGLLAHELIHVAQQQRTVSARPPDATREAVTNSALEDATLETPSSAQPSLESPRLSGAASRRFVPALPSAGTVGSADTRSADTRSAGEFSNIASHTVRQSSAPLLENISSYASEEDRALAAEARVVQIARTESLSADPTINTAAPSWNGLPAPWERLPSFETRSNDEGVVSLIGAGLSPQGWGGSATTTNPVGYASSVSSSSAVSSVSSGSSAMTAAPQAAEVGRELPQVGGVAASASGGPDLEQLAKQVYDVLKRRLQSDRRRGGL